MIAKCRECEHEFDNFEKRGRQGRYLVRGRIYCSANCKRKVYLRMKKKEREDKFFDGKREEALRRDGFSCVVCGKREGLQVHHKDGNGRGSKRPNNDINNLVTLCQNCHIRIHAKFMKIDFLDKVISLWDLSDRKIAKITGCTHPTIARARKIISEINIRK